MRGFKHCLFISVSLFARKPCCFFRYLIACLHCKAFYWNWSKQMHIQTVFSGNTTKPYVLLHHQSSHNLMFIYLMFISHKNTFLWPKQLPGLRLSTDNMNREMAWPLRLSLLDASWLLVGHTALVTRVFFFFHLKTGALGSCLQPFSQGS